MNTMKHDELMLALSRARVAHAESVVIDNLKAKGLVSNTSAGTTFAQDEAVERNKFELWIGDAPYERCLVRFPDDDTQTNWPGQYRSRETELAWQAWLERSKQKDESAKEGL